MTDLALERLFNAVTASFAADQINAVNVFGWREVAQHPYGPRIVWQPGDTTNSVGTTGPARNPGGYPRALGTLNELFTVIISAEDESEPENELKQYHIVRMLRDAWYRAVYNAAYGTFQVRSESWTTDKNERRAGASLRLVCEIQSPIVDALPDEPLIGNPALADAIDGRPLGVSFTVDADDDPDDDDELERVDIPAPDEP